MSPRLGDSRGLQGIPGEGLEPRHSQLERSDWRAPASANDAQRGADRRRSTTSCPSASCARRHSRNTGLDFRASDSGCRTWATADPTARCDDGASSETGQFVQDYPVIVLDVTTDDSHVDLLLPVSTQEFSSANSWSRTSLPFECRRTRCGSSTPISERIGQRIQSGCCWVPSKRVLILYSSYLPSRAADLVRFRRLVTSARVSGLKVRTASSPWSRIC